MADHLFMTVALAALVPVATRARAAEPPATQPALRTVEEVYPMLASRALRLATLRHLPDGVRLQCGELRITQTGLSQELKTVPAHTREQFRKSPFFFLEQIATPRLLLKAARRQSGCSEDPTGGTSQDEIIKNYLATVFNNFCDKYIQNKGDFLPG